MNRQAMTQKMMVLGVDGFDPAFAKFLMDADKMPNLKKFVERGSAREDLMLLGNMPTVTPPMWTTLATGATAATHGITAFFNQHPTKIDTTVYALDSRLCKAEALWNVTAEAGKNTLVWHWPGSSWPPTSNSEKLSVVDGTQPSFINMGTALVDWEKVCLAAEDIAELQFAAHDATDKGVAGCVITGLENTIAQEAEGGLTSAGVRKLIAGGAKETTMLVLNEKETEINLLSDSNSDIINSPIKPAQGWANAPEGAKEFTLLTSGGYSRRPCLILRNEGGIYDRIAIYKSKKATEPLITAMKDVYTLDYVDEVTKNDEIKNANRSLRVLELAEDGSRVRFWLSYAFDLDSTMVWHPKTLHEDIYTNIGPVPPIPAVTAKVPENIDKLLLPGWDIYCKWQADCLTYLMDGGKYEVIFSHLHNVDGLGHKFWHYGKHRDQWDNDEAYYQSCMVYTYKQTDDYLGRFLGYLDQGWTIIITSDHGLISEENHPPVLTEGCVSVPVMKELGFTVLKKDASGKDLRELDLTKTRAVAIRGGQIYINLKGRNPGGIVEAKDKYTLEEEIITALYNYKDPHTGRRVVSIALRNKDAALIGMNGPDCGDIIFFAEEGFNIIHMDSLSTQQGYYHTSVSPIFVAAGPGIKAGFTTNRVIRQVDVAPTMAALAGVRMPAECEGAPAYQIFSEEF